MVVNTFVGIEEVAERMKDSIPKVEWDFEGIHYFDNGPLTVQYLFVLDALNFCFWPGMLLITSHLFTVYTGKLSWCIWIRGFGGGISNSK